MNPEHIALVLYCTAKFLATKVDRFNEEEVAVYRELLDGFYRTTFMATETYEQFKKMVELQPDDQ